MSKKEKVEIESSVELEARVELLEKQVAHILAHMKPLAYKAGVSYTPLEEKHDD